MPAGAPLAVPAVTRGLDEDQQVKIVAVECVCVCERVLLVSVY